MRSRSPTRSRSPRRNSNQVKESREEERFTRSSPLLVSNEIRKNFFKGMMSTTRELQMAREKIEKKRSQLLATASTSNHGLISYPLPVPAKQRLSVSRLQTFHY